MPWPLGVGKRQPHLCINTIQLEQELDIRTNQSWLHLLWGDYNSATVCSNLPPNPHLYGLKHSRNCKVYVICCLNKRNFP